VVNNAGLGLVSEIEWCSVDQFQRILDVNVLGVVRVTKAFLPLLRHSKGRVVNVASLAGISHFSSLSLSWLGFDNEDFMRGFHVFVHVHTDG
jgi:NADP-dependent 3-hydroxy acid dehydrogenase YdfG